MVAPNLPVIEVLFYGLVWSGSFAYSIYCVYLAGQLFDDTRLGDDFSIGLYGYKKDVTDYEWTTWLPFMLYVLPPWIGAHLVLSEVTRWLAPKAIPALYTLITCSFLCVNFSPFCAVYNFILVVLYYMIFTLRSILLLWIFGIPLLLLSCFAFQEFWEYGGREDLVFSFMLLGITWLYLRWMSFSIDVIKSTPTGLLGWNTFYDFLGYCFYLPTFFLGPHIIYSNFGPYMYRPFESWTWRRLGLFVINMLRYMFWAAVTEASLYFLFIHALQYHMTTVAMLSEWTFYGLGFLLGQFFCVKYISVYGLASTIANFEGYIAPPPPRCAARIHLYTDMWRRFDVGYYQFIHKYIYSPLCAGRRDFLRRLMASAVSFVFVFIWHGPHTTIFIWSLLNFLVVTLVSFCTALCKTDTYRNWERRNLSEANSRRLTALVSAPLFIVGPTATLYFFSGLKIANTYVKHLIFNGTWLGRLTVLCVSYCICQVSIEMKNWEERRAQKLKSN